MSNSELHISVPSFILSGEFIKEIGGIKLAENGLYENECIPEMLVGVTGDEEIGYMLPFSELLKLNRISEHHGRSYEIELPEKIGAWEDEYGNIYSSATIKGINFIKPHLLYHNAAPKDFIVYGLQDSDSLVRMIKASKILRSLGIETENITRVMIPHEIPYGEDLLTQQEFKSKLLEKFIEDSLAKQLNLKNDPSPTIQSMLDFGVFQMGIDPKAAQYLKDAVFVITTRDMQTSERMIDFSKITSNEEFELILQKAFDYVNFSERLKAEKDPTYSPKEFNISKKGDVEKYFLEYLPIKIATNLAEMHDVGLAHGFMTGHNISTVGSIYDLDSVSGAPLDIDEAEEIGPEEKMKDLQWAMISVGEVISGLVENKYLSNENAPELIIHKAKNSEVYEYQAKLIEVYESSVKKTIDIVEFMPVINTLMNGALYEEINNLVEKYLPKLEDSLHLNYSFDMEYKEIQKNFILYMGVLVSEIKENPDLSPEQIEEELFSEKALNDFAFNLVDSDFESKIKLVFEEKLASYVKRIFVWSESQKLIQKIISAGEGAEIGTPQEFIDSISSVLKSSQTASN